MSDKPIIGVDLDGTIIKYDGWKGNDHFGETQEGARQKLQRLSEIGVIIIYTCRRDEGAVKEMLDRRNIPYDYVNENPYQPDDVNDKKLWLDVYIGDEAVAFEGNWNKALIDILVRLKE